MAVTQCVGAGSPVWVRLTRHYLHRMTDPIRDALQAALGPSFTLGRELGGGGMSRVFLARDSALAREVVVKLLSPELAQELSVERFGREIALAAALQHANIVPVLSAGVTANGLPYYLMPFIEGSSLRDLVSGNKAMPINDVLLVLNDVCRALAYAHGRSVVHRDIKPDNVMLSGGAALVTDFGIAKAMSSARTTSSNDQLTRMGTSIGTAAYMAPEQGAGDPDADHRADIYALGAMAYELLTGHPPFGTRAPHAQLVAHLSEAPVPVSTLRADAPEPLARLVMQCLEKDPAMRPQQATDALEYLADAALATRTGTTAQYSARGAATAHAATGGPVASRPGQTHRARNATVLAVAVGAVAVAAVWFVKRGPSAPTGPDASLVAVMPFTVRDASLDVWREGMVDILARSLDGAGSLRTVSPSMSIAKATTRGDVTTATALGTSLGAGLVVFGELSPVGRDSVRARVALVDVARGKVQQDVDISGEATRIDALADSVAIQLIRSLGSSGGLVGGARLSSMGTSSLAALKAYLQGQQYYRRGVVDSSLSAFELAVSIDSLFGLGWRGVASTYIRKGQEGRPEAQAALDRAIRLKGGGSPRDSLLLHGDSLRLAVVRRTPTATDPIDEIPALTALFATLTEATRRYPNDAELWLELGDAGFHFGALAQRSDSVVLGDFRKAIALDSMLIVPYFHAQSLAMRLGRFREAAGYSEHIPRLQPGSSPIYAVIKSLLDSAPAYSAAARAHFDTLPVAYVASLLQQFGEVPEATPLALAIAKTQLERLAKTPSLADSAPFARLLQQQQVRGGKAGESQQLLTLNDRVQLARAGVLQTAAVLAEAAPLLVSKAVTLGPVMPLFASARDTVALQTMVRVFDSVDVATRARGEGATAHQSDAARAYLALARGDSSAALRGFLSIPMAMCGGSPCAVAVTARLLMNARRDAEAARLLDRALPSSMASVLAPQLMSMRAEVAERMNDRATARGWYQRVIAQWGAGDAAFQPTVKAAQAGLGRVK